MPIPGLWGFRLCTRNAAIFLFLEIHWKSSSRQKVKSNWNTTFYEYNFPLFSSPTKISFKKKSPNWKKECNLLTLMTNFIIWSLIHSQEKLRTFSFHLLYLNSTWLSLFVCLSVTHKHTHTCSLDHGGFIPRPGKTFCACKHSSLSLIIRSALCTHSSLLAAA